MDLKKSKGRIIVHLLIPVILCLFILFNQGIAKMREIPKSFTLKGRLSVKIDQKVMPAVDIEKLKREDARQEKENMKAVPLRFAMVLTTDFTLENSGTWETLQDGSRLWRLHIWSKDAKNLSLGITKYKLPEGCKLWIYSPLNNHVEGPYTRKHRSRKGRLWTPIIVGNQMVIELFVPDDVQNKPVVVIGKVNHGYRGLTFPEKVNGDQEPCNIDVICAAGNPWRNEISSVAEYTFQDSNWGYSCSGTLVNNTNEDFTPYFLTAYHCEVDASNQDTVVVYWNYFSPNCGDYCCGSSADNQTGVTLRAAYDPSDVRLLELDDQPDLTFNVYYAGWDAAGTAPPSSVCIHHPAGGEKSISFDNHPASSTAAFSDTMDPSGIYWRIGNWDAGTTEGGSSGSALWDTSTHLIVGHLRGGYAGCLETTPTIDNDLPDWFGKFSTGWTGGGTDSTRLSNWLDPAGGGTNIQWPGAEPPAGPGPIMRIQSTYLDYGGLELGFAFTKAIVVYNDGNAPLTVTVQNQPTGDEAHWVELNGVTDYVIAPGSNPLVLTQVYQPTALNTHTTQFLVTGNDPINPSQIVTLTGEGVSPTPFSSVLVLDRSGSMKENAGDRKKIDAMRDAADLYAHLLRSDIGGTGTGDKIGLVKYNKFNQEYLSLNFIDDPNTPGSHMEDLEINKLSNDALNDYNRIRPTGSTGIGGAMERAANMLLAPGDGLRHIFVVLSDGIENQSPYISDVIGPLQSADPDLQMYSVGVGSNIEPTKLQDITNVGNGYHQVADDLSGISYFDLETFYFKIFANVSGMDLAVDPTFLVPIAGKNPLTIAKAIVTSSDCKVTFLVLDIPELRKYYKLELVAPNGQVIGPSSVIGSTNVFYLQRHTYTIYKIKNANTTPECIGSWVLRLTPKENSDKISDFTANTPKSLQRMCQKTRLVPVGFAAAVASNYRMKVDVLPVSRLTGAPVLLTATTTDRGWPVTGVNVMVDVTTPGGKVIQTISLFDDGTHGDTIANDGIRTGKFVQTGQTGSYRFVFRSIGTNHRGELTLRENSRYLTLGPPSSNPVGSQSTSPFALSLHTGLTLPITDLGSRYNSSYMYEFNIDYHISPQLSLVGFLGYNHFLGANPFIIDTYWWNLSANLKFEFNTNPLRPYINSGVGIYIPMAGSAKPGFNIGIGLNRNLTTNLILEIGIDYHHILTNPEDPEFFTGHIGVIFKL